MSDLTALLAYVIPAAIGSALSPTLFITTTGLLSVHDRPRQRAFSFLIGAIASLCLWVIIVYSALWALLQNVASDAASDWHSNRGVIDVVLGLALLALAGYLAFRPDRPPKPHGTDRAATPLWRIAVLGAVFEGRDVSSMILFIAALQQIARSPLPDGTKLIVVLGVMAITTLPIWLPLVAHVSIPHRFIRRTEPLLTWMRSNRRRITIWVSAFFGLLLLLRAALV